MISPDGVLRLSGQKRLFALIRTVAFDPLPRDHPLDDQSVEVIAAAANNRAYHGARIGIQEIQIQFQNRLTRRDFRTLFYQTLEAPGTVQRDGIDTIWTTISAPFGFRQNALKKIFTIVPAAGETTFTGGFHRHAVADRFAGESFIRYLIQRHYLTGNRRDQFSDSHRIRTASSRAGAAT